MGQRWVSGGGLLGGGAACVGVLLAGGMDPIGEVMAGGSAGQVGRPYVAAEATVLFLNHGRLREHVDSRGMDVAQWDAGRAIYARRLRDVTGGVAIAFLDEEQACLALVRGQAFGGGELAFLDLLEPAIAYVGAGASDDCRIEVHGRDADRDFDFAVVEFMDHGWGESGPAGWMLMRRGDAASRIVPIWYGSPEVTRGVEELRWESRELRDWLYRFFDERDAEFLRLESSGAVVQKEGERRRAVFFREGMDALEVKICTRDELAERIGEREVEGMTDEQVALRVLPGVPVRGDAGFCGVRNLPVTKVRGDREKGGGGGGGSC